MVDLVKCEVCDRELWLSFTHRFRKGHTPWNKGLTKETDERVAKNVDSLRSQHSRSKAWETRHKNDLDSKSMKKGWDTRRKRYGRTGVKNPEMVSKRISDRLRGRPPWNKGLSWFTDIRVAKNRESNITTNRMNRENNNYGQKKAWKTRRKKYGSSGFKNPKEYRKQVSKYTKGRKASNKGITKKENPNMGGWNITVEEKEERVKKIFLGFQVKPNKPERILLRIITKNNLPFNYTGDKPYFGLGGYMPDFVSTDGHKRILEVFGDYWHNLFNIKKKDNVRLKFFHKLGYVCLIIWEHEINSSTEQELVERIRQFCSIPQILNTTTHD